jgi:hypothetical protein
VHRTVDNGCPVAQRTVRCAYCQQPLSTARKWLGAINTPQPPHSLVPKFSEHPIHYKSNRLHSKTHSIDQILSKPPNQLNSIRDLREGVLCSFVALVSLGFPSFFSHSYSQVLCKQSKRHQVCGGPCGVLVTHVIKEKAHSV